MRVAALVAAVLAAASLGLGGSPAETVSLSVRPTVLGPADRAVATGAVGSGRPDQLVTIQLRPCDESAWREIAETRTHDGGGWTLDVSPGIGGALRAASGGALSEPLRILQKPSVSFGQRPPGTFFAWVNAQRPFWHKRLTIQRFDPKRRQWTDVRRVLLTETGAPPGVSYVYSGTEKFRLKVAKGTQLRATLPLSQARPCYLAGTSNVLTR